MQADLLHSECKGSNEIAGWRIERNDGCITVWHDSIGGYASEPNTDNIASTILYHLAETLLQEPQPRPQPADQAQRIAELEDMVQHLTAALRDATKPMSTAAGYVLGRMQRDGRLAYLIGPGSQTYDLLTQEAAQAAGRDVAEFRREFDATLHPERWPSEADILDRIEVAIEADRRRARA